jgi:GNAT superfamily N-acetyltransferase
MRIAFLKDHPAHVETVSRWIFDEWDHVTVADLDAEIRIVRDRLNDDRVPLSLVALDGTECAGTVSIYTYDLDSRRDLTPWLAALYVRPDRRDRGIGGALVDRTIAVARGLGIGTLYLHTETAAGFYRRRGWRFLFPTVNDRGERTEVFDMDLPTRRQEPEPAPGQR